MITHQVLNDIKQSVISSKLVNQLVSDYQKGLAELGWHLQQLSLYFSLLPNTDVTAQGDDWQVIIK